MSSNPTVDPAAATEEQEVSLEQLAEQLGPFAPPPTFAHPKELNALPPRDLPAATAAGWVARRNRAGAQAMTVVGAFCWVVSQLHVTDTIAYYLLPLQYLNWIGMGLFAIGLVWAMWPKRFGPFKYAREGAAAVGRVIAVTPYLAGTRESPQAGYAVFVQYQNPDTKALEFAQCNSELLDAPAALPKYSIDAQPGQYLTLIGMPSRYTSTVRAYGLLGLTEASDLIRKDGRRREPMSSAAVLGITLAAVSGVTLLLLGAMYMFIRFPTGGYARWGWIAGGGAVLGVLSFLVFGLRGEDANKPLLAKLGAGFLSALGGAALLGMAAGLFNALADTSPPKYIDIELVNGWETTWNMVWRTYQIEYRQLDNGKVEKQESTHETLQKIGETGLGVAEIGQGALGMSWIRGLHPLTLQQIDRNASQPADVIVLRAAAMPSEGSDLAVVIDLGDGQTMPASERLVDLLMKKIDELPDEPESQN